MQTEKAHRNRLAEIRSLRQEGSISRDEAAKLRRKANAERLESLTGSAFGGVKSPPVMVSHRPWSPTGTVGAIRPGLYHLQEVARLVQDILRLPRNPDGTPIVQRLESKPAPGEGKAERGTVGWRGGKTLPFNVAVVFAVLRKRNGDIATKEEVYTFSEADDPIAGAHQRARQLLHSGGWQVAVLQPAHPYAEVNHDLTCPNGHMAEDGPYRVKAVLNTSPACPECGSACKAEPVGKGWSAGKQALIGLSREDHFPTWGMVLGPVDQHQIAQYLPHAGYKGRKKESKDSEAYREHISAVCRETDVELSNVDIPQPEEDNGVEYRLDLQAPLFKKQGDHEVPLGRTLVWREEPKPNLDDIPGSGAERVAARLVTEAALDTISIQPGPDGRPTFPRAYGVNAPWRVRWTCPETGEERSLLRSQVLLGEADNPAKDEDVEYDPEEEPNEPRMDLDEFLTLAPEERIKVSRGELPPPRQRYAVHNGPTTGALGQKVKNSRKGGTWDAREAAEHGFHMSL